MLSVEFTDASGRIIFMSRMPVKHILSVCFTVDQFNVIMAALCNRGAIIFLPCDFYLSSFFFFFFPRLISAVGDWMSTILLHMVWP